MELLLLRGPKGLDVPQETQTSAHGGAGRCFLFPSRSPFPRAKKRPRAGSGGPQTFSTRYAKLSARSGDGGRGRSLGQPRRWKEAARQSEQRPARRESSRRDKISGKEAALMPRNCSRYRNAGSDRRHVARRYWSISRSKEGACRVNRSTIYGARGIYRKSFNGRLLRYFVFCQRHEGYLHN